MMPTRMSDLSNQCDDLKTSSVIQLHGSRRLQTVLLLGLCNVVCYADRVNIGIAIIPMTTELGFDRTTKALILSSFFWGYLVTQTLAGSLCRQYGTARVLTGAVFVWSLMTLATPYAAKQSIPVLVLVRVVMGLGEGLSQPVIHAILASWVPPPERATCVTLASGGQALGTILAMLTSPLADLHWPSIFYIFGCMGFVWCLLAIAYLVDTPAEHKNIAAEEQDYIEKTLKFEHKEQQARAVPKLPKGVLNLMSTTSFAAIYVAHFATNWSIYIVISWMPTYLESLGAEVTSVGFVAVLPYVCYWLCDIAWGKYADRMILRGGVSTRAARVLSQCIASVGPSIVLLAMATYPPTTPTSAMLMLCIAMGMYGPAHSGYWANILDISPPDRTADVLGISNTVATVPGIVGNIYVGWVLSTYDSWALVWLSAVIINMVGIAAFERWCRA
eukprot:m.214623 g.214623  ORF g.214623 m.214623 type:complete len:445 (-) comp19073_c0_seq1:38-1372(-)